MARAFMVVEHQYVNLLISCEGTGLGNISVMFWGTGEQPLQIWPRFKQAFLFNVRVKSVHYPPCAPDDVVHILTSIRVRHSCCQDFHL